MTTSDEFSVLCHDHSEHPQSVLCEEQKRLIERRNAEESLRMWRRRKAEELARKEKEKRDYYDLCMKHYPWGRPGGGAPNLDIRRKDITELGLHSTPPVSTVMQRLSGYQPCRVSEYFLRHSKRCLDPVNLKEMHKPRHHYHHLHHHHSMPKLHAAKTQAITQENESVCPNIGSAADTTVTLCEADVSTDGYKATAKVGCPIGSVEASACDSKAMDSLEITLKDHPSLSFRNKGHLDIELCYKPLAFHRCKPMLEKISVTKHDDCDHAAIKKVDDLKSDPANKSKKKLIEELEKPPNTEPWGKAGPGGKPWRSSKTKGNTFMKSLGWTNKEVLKELDQDNPATPAEKQTFRKSRVVKKSTNRCCDLCVCTCPSISVTAHSMKPFRKPLELRHNICSRLLSCTDKNKSNQINLNTRIAKVESPTDQSANLTTTNDDPKMDNCSTSNVELVPLLAKRRAQQRPISLSSTDVTKCTAPNDRLDDVAAELRYLHDLSSQVTQRHQMRCAERHWEQNASLNHFQVFDNFWGRPGHGAPYCSTNRKLNLQQLLYGNPNDSE